MVDGIRGALVLFTYAFIDMWCSNWVFIAWRHGGWRLKRCVGVGLLLGRIEGIRGMRADLIYKSVWRERKSTWFLYLYIAGGLRIGVGY